MNTEKNSYTIIYSIIMVVLAAVLLAVAATSLKPAQQENEKIDKMEQILRSIGQTPAKSDVKNVYNKFIKEEILLDGEGTVLKTFKGDELTNSEAFNNNTELEMKLLKKGEKSAKDVRLNAFVADVVLKSQLLVSLTNLRVRNYTRKVSSRVSQS